MLVSARNTDNYSTTVEVALPNGRTLDVMLSCTPEIGHDRYRLSLKAALGFTVIAEADRIIDEGTP